MSVVRWLLLVVLVVAAVPAALFTIQNLGWTAQLSLDFHVWASRLKQPVPVPYLMWGSFGVGLLGGMITIPALKAAFSGGADPLKDDFGSPTH